MKKYISLLLLSVLFALQSCVQVNSVGGSFKRLDVEEFKDFIADSTVQLVDVRTPEEFSAGHLPDVDHNLDVRSATFFKDYQSLPKDKTIALYCKGGGRSKQVAGVLAGNGYKVVELAVGYDGWVKAGGKVDK